MPEERYKDRRNELAKIRDDSLDSFDKSVLQLSTGTLVLMITFLDKIGKPYNGLTLCLLLASWISFVLVISGHLLSFYFATKNADFKIADLDRRVREHAEKWIESEPKECGYKKATEMCNWSILGIFVLGIVLFLTYAGLVQHKQYIEISTESKKEAVMSERKSINEGKTETPELSYFKKGKTESPEQVVITNPGTVTVEPPKEKDE